MKMICAFVLLLLSVILAREWMLVEFGLVSLCYSEGTVSEVQMYDITRIGDAGRRFQVKGSKCKVQYYHDDILFEKNINIGGGVDENTHISIGFKENDPTSIITVNGSYLHGGTIVPAFFCFFGSVFLFFSIMLEKHRT